MNAKDRVLRRKGTGILFPPTSGGLQQTTTPETGACTRVTTTIATSAGTGTATIFDSTP
jgi:hypothetical protein